MTPLNAKQQRIMRLADMRRALDDLYLEVNRASYTTLELVDLDMELRYVSRRVDVVRELLNEKARTV